MHPFPQKITQLRLVLSLSQYQIAYFLNISQSSYSLWETGETHLRWKNLQALAAFYQITVAELLDGDTDELLIRVLKNPVLKSLRSGGGVNKHSTNKKAQPTLAGLLCVV
jgi:transcriptional regulator with XRE-family HTH domain